MIGALNMFPKFIVWKTENRSCGRRVMRQFLRNTSRTDSIKDPDTSEDAYAQQPKTVDALIRLTLWRKSRRQSQLFSCHESRWRSTRSAMPLVLQPLKRNQNGRNSDN